MFCPQCGKPFPDGNKFCVHCSQPDPAAAPAAQPVPAPAQKSASQKSASLIVALCVVGGLLLIAILVFLGFIIFKGFDTNPAEEDFSYSLEETMAPTEAPTEPPTEPPVIATVTISAVGDMTLGTNQAHSYNRSFHAYYDKYGCEYFLQNVKSVFAADDFTIGNLEGTLTTSSQKANKPAMKPGRSAYWYHRGKPEYVDVLTAGSVEAVSLGNNHIMDYRQQGADDTMQALSGAGIGYAIDGTWGTQYGLYETDEGILIGYLSVSEWDEGDTVCYELLTQGLAYLENAGAQLKIACLHWGENRIYELEDEQYEMGKWCIDQGFDVVLGCHPHVLQGIEYYKGKYIVYSMGNFCYGGNKNPDDKDTMIWQQTFTFVDGVLQAGSDATVIPCRLSSTTKRNDYCPVILEGQEAQKVLDKINRLSEEFGVVFDEKGKHIP